MKRILLYGLLVLGWVSMGAQEQLPYPKDTIDGKVYYRYTVEKSIGLYRISKNFGVSQEDILRANPDLKERGLRFEEEILIPVAGEQLKPVRREERKPLLKPTVIAVKQDTVVLPPAPVDTPELVVAEDTVHAVQYTDTVRLAYLLPLHADIAQRSPVLDRFYDFYAGSLLALKHHDGTYVDSLGVQHIPYYDIHTYDIGKTGQVLCPLVDSGAFARTDAILGPAYYKQVEVIAGYAQTHHIPVMVPFLPSVPDITTNPYLMKFNAYEEIQIHSLMEYLDTLRSDINIVLVDAYASKRDYPGSISKLRDSIAARGLPTTHTTIRQILADSVGASLKDSVENLLLFHSERYSNVQLLMPYLLSGRHGKRLTLLSEYAWQTERILLPQLFTSVFATPQGEALERYEQDFAKYFGHELSSRYPRYDLLGYDLTNFMLEALKDGTFRVPDTLVEGIQSSLLFTKIGDGGYENTHITIERR